MRQESPPKRLEPTIGALATRQHGLVTRAQLGALGFDDRAISRRVDAGRLHRVHRGVYAVGHRALAPSGQRLAAVLAFGDLAVASHITATAIWDLRATSASLMHVTVTGDARSRPGIAVYRRALEPADRTSRSGIPVTSLARTLVDLGDVVPLNQVRNAFVRAEQLRLIDMTAIDAALGRAGRRRGASRLREVLRVYDPRWERTRSVLEIAFLEMARAGGLPEPEVNAWIEGRFLVDALWREPRVVVEVDSRTFHAIPSARRDDARRDRVLRSRGYRVLRLSHDAIVHHPRSTARAVQTALTWGKPARNAGFALTND